MKKILSSFLMAAILPLLVTQCNNGSDDYTTNRDGNKVMSRSNLEYTYVTLDVHSDALGISRVSFDTKSNEIWLDEQLYSSGGLVVSYWEASRPDQYSLELKANGDDGSTFYFLGRLEYNYEKSSDRWTPGDIKYWQMKKNGTTGSGNSGYIQVWNNY